MGSPTGDARGILGYAYAPNASEPAELKVHFDVNPVDGNYWVVKLGPRQPRTKPFAARAMTMPLSAIPPRSRCSSWRVTMTNSTATTMPPSLTTSTRKVSTPGSTPVPTYQGKDCIYP